MKDRRYYRVYAYLNNNISGIPSTVLKDIYGQDRPYHVRKWI